MEGKPQQDDELLMNLVELALAQPETQRESFLESACSGDSDLFSQAWNYVQWETRMNGFLLDPLYPATEDENPFEPGQLLDARFRIVRELARGGMGIVYEAIDEKLDRRIALKCAMSGFRKRLPPEVRHASEISHPNVCKIFEIHTASTDGGEVDFLTMEFLEGETLAARLNRGTLPEAEARIIGSQICAGLAEAHRNKVVHGDLKSSNVILTQDAGGGVRAVITDFGLARKPLGPAEDISALGSGQAGGTPDYMAPELWAGQKPSPSSDVYALGVILYELAAGKRPFPPRDARGTHEEIPSQQHPKQTLPPARYGDDSILKRCLDPAPAERFHDAVEVEAALEASRSRPWKTKVAAAVIFAAIALAVVSGLVTYKRTVVPKEQVRLAMLPLHAGSDGVGSDAGAADLADRISRDAAGALARLNGGPRVRLSVVPGKEISGRHVDTVEKAGSLLGATHVVRGTVTRENGKVIVHALLTVLTDARTQANYGDWKAEYTLGEVHYAPVAIAGMVTAALHLPPVATAPVNSAGKENYLAGLKYIRRNSTVDRAVPLLESAVAADSDSPLTWAGLGEAQWFKYFLTKDLAWLDRASESLRQAQNRNLDLAPVHRLTGLLRANAGFYEQAEAEYRRAIELDPANGDAYRRLGHVYERNHRLDQALVEFKKAVELVPNDFKAYQDLGHYYSQYGDEREAVRQFEKCVQLVPDEPDAHRVLGTAYKDLGRYEEAERELRVAVGLAPTPTALSSLAVSLMYRGRDLEAIPFLSRAASQSPSESLLWMDLGTAYRLANLPEKAQWAYRQGLEQADKATARNPSDGDIRSLLAFLCARLGDRKRAETEIAQALHFSPESSNTRQAAVWTYEVLGQRQNALAILETSSEDVLLDAARWPDLADLHKDSRFKQLLASHQIKE